MVYPDHDLQYSSWMGIWFVSDVLPCTWSRRPRSPVKKHDGTIYQVYSRLAIDFITHLPQQVICPCRTWLKGLAALSELPPGTRLPNSTSLREPSRRFPSTSITCGTFRPSLLSSFFPCFFPFFENHTQLDSAHTKSKPKTTTVISKSIVFKESKNSRETDVQNSSQNRKAVKTDSTEVSYTRRMIWYSPHTFYYAGIICLCFKVELEMNIAG